MKQIHHLHISYILKFFRRSKVQLQMLSASRVVENCSNYRKLSFMSLCCCLIRCVIWHVILWVDDIMNENATGQISNHKMWPNLETWNKTVNFWRFIDLEWISCSLNIHVFRNLICAIQWISKRKFQTSKTLYTKLLRLLILLPMTMNPRSNKSRTSMNS